jgi:hypothetical protein
MQDQQHNNHHKINESQDTYNTSSHQSQSHQYDDNKYKAKNNSLMENFSKSNQQRDNNENYVKNSNDNSNNNHRNTSYNNESQPTFNVKLGFNESGQVNSIKPDVKMSVNDAKNIYNANKQYLPTKDQMIDGAKKTGNYIEKSGIMESEPVKEVKKKDPLTNLFGFGGGKKK